MKGRLVFIPEEKRDHLWALGLTGAWDAAPADPAEAIANALVILPKTPEAATAVAQSLLIVLGVPEESA